MSNKDYTTRMLQALALFIFGLMAWFMFDSQALGTIAWIVSAALYVLLEVELLIEKIFITHLDIHHNTKNSGQNHPAP